MDMDLLFTVKRLADARAATRPPPPSTRPPRRISVRQRRAQEIAGQESRRYEESLRAAAPPDPTNARLRALQHRARRRGQQHTRQQAEDACRALLRQGWDAAADVEDSDSEEEEVVDARARMLNERAERLWAKHEEGIARTTPRYVEGLPVRGIEGAPRVRRRVRSVRESGLGRCKGCEREGLRCSRVEGRGRGEEEEEVCERCRRRGESCEDGDGEEGKGTGLLEVVGGRVVEVERARFAPRMPEKEAW